MAEELNMKEFLLWVAITVWVGVLLHFGIWYTRDPKKDRKWSRTNDPKYRPNDRGPSIVTEAAPPRGTIELEETPRHKPRRTHGPPKKKE